MTMFGRLLNGDGSTGWKWMFCRKCEQEWFVPDIPDAYPKFCCHCTQPIDTDINPSTVLADVPHEHDFPPMRFDLDPEPLQLTLLSLGRGSQVRAFPTVDEVELEAGTIAAVGHEVTILANEWVALRLQMSHRTFVELVDFINQYRTEVVTLLDDDEFSEDAESLLRFNNYMQLGPEDES